MGTNYYCNLNLCSHCQRFDKVHLGKISGGWRFLARSSEEYPIRSWDEFQEFILKNSNLIWNEYGDKVDVNVLLKQIKDMSDQKIHTAYGMQKIIHSGPIDIANYEFF